MANNNNSRDFISLNYIKQTFKSSQFIFKLIKNDNPDAASL